MVAWRAPPTSRLRVHTHLDASVVCIHLAPGFDDSAIAAMIKHATSLKGIVLSLYGTGNGPSQKLGECVLRTPCRRVCHPADVCAPLAWLSDFLETIKTAISKGILVVAATQCTRGPVSLDTYEVGRKLLDLGVVSAGDMTIESVVTKTAFLLGRNVTGERLQRLMYEDLRGERTVASSSRTGSWKALSSLGQIPWRQ